MAKKAYTYNVYSNSFVDIERFMLEHMETYVFKDKKAVIFNKAENTAFYLKIVRNAVNSSVIFCNLSVIFLRYAIIL